MRDIYIRITRPEGYEDIHPELILQDMNIDPVWGAEVVGVDAVLRECREAMQKAKYSGTPYTSSYNRAIAKIDWVLK